MSDTLEVIAAVLALLVVVAASHRKAELAAQPTVVYVAAPLPPFHEYRPTPSPAGPHYD